MQKTIRVWCLLVLVTSMRRCIFLFLFFCIWVCKLFFGVFWFFIFSFFCFFYFMFVVVASHYLLKGRTRARFGSSRYCAQLFLFLFLLFLLLCSCCVPPSVLLCSCVLSWCRPPSSSSCCCCVLQNVLVLDFNKLYTNIGL